MCIRDREYGESCREKAKRRPARLSRITERPSFTWAVYSAWVSQMGKPTATSSAASFISRNVARPLGGRSIQFPPILTKQSGKSTFVLTKVFQNRVEPLCQLTDSRFLETEADDEDTLSMEKGKLLRRQSWREISASTNKKQ